MTKVKFDTSLSLILVDALFIGKNEKQALSLKLALDTGAAVTAISTGIIEFLGYSPENSAQKGRLITGSGIEYAPVIKVRKILLGNEPLEDVEIHCHNFPPEKYIDGVIGLNCLKNFNFCINYDDGEITLTKRDVA